MSTVIYHRHRVYEEEPMKVSREQAAQNRERILDAATALFREHGFDGIGVADLMKQAGLTHGGFYGQFESKDDLVVQACARSFAASHKRWLHDIETSPDPLRAIVKRYLSMRHRDEPGQGCTLTTVAVDAPRRGRALQRAFTDGLRPYINMLGRLLPGRRAEVRRQRALVAMSTLVGAIVLARAVDDRALSDEILAATAASFDQG
jgi:TetR/AcrR family transcriptional regulator, transcriptional repressor for nem operon